MFIQPRELLGGSEIFHFGPIFSQIGLEPDTDGRWKNKKVGPKSHLFYYHGLN